jgi:NADH-quinone oxidoreductase subunit C
MDSIGMADEQKHAAKPPAVMQTTPWEGELPELLNRQFGAQLLECASYLGQNFVVMTPGAVLPAIELLQLDADFDYLVDLTAVDYPTRPRRFELVYTLYSFSRNEHLRVKTRIADGQEPESLTEAFSGANWLEREVFDMFGIRFHRHPGLKRILLPDEWNGFPLRKDASILAMDNDWVKQNLGIESGQ